MVNDLSLSPLEKEIQQLLAVSEPHVDFRRELHSRLVKAQPSVRRKHPNVLLLKPVFITLLVVLILLAASIFYYGPDVVYAAISKLFGYIPGIGLVDQSAPIRVLKEPVSQTRDGITVTVYEAILTAEKSEIHYGVSGVPLSAYPAGEAAIGGCMQSEYLLLPDGQEMAIYEPVPPEINEAILVIPCFFNTLPDTIPTDWRIPLEFIPLPEDVTIIPVQEFDFDEQEASNGTPTPLTPENESTGIPQTNDPAVHIEKIIQTEEGYILMGSIAIDANLDGWTQITGNPQIIDAKNTKVNYELPTDIHATSEDNSHIPWVVQFKAANVTFPITLQFSGESYQKVTADSPTHLTFDAGDNPQSGQEWEINHNFSIAGYEFCLETIRAGTNGYSFSFDTSLNEGSMVTPPSVEINGYQAWGGGGGSRGTSLIFSEIPKGKLELIFSSFHILSDRYTWTAEWQPEDTRTDWPTPTPPPTGICVNEENHNQLKALPTDMTGLIIRTELNPEVNLVQTDLNGENRKVFGSGRNRGALSPDGNRLAYGSEEGMHLVNLSDGSETTLAGLGSHELSWSPDSSQIALVNPLDRYGVFVTNLTNHLLTQVSNLGYETIAGWSPDGRRLYYAIPGSDQEGFQLKEYDLTSGETSDAMILNDSSLKAPSARISPDGAWVAYRGRGHNQVYLASMDGKQNRLVLSLPSDRYVVNGIQWEINKGLLGISIQDYKVSENQTSRLYFLDVSTCSGYVQENFVGEFNGAKID